MAASPDAEGGGAGDGLLAFEDSGGYSGSGAAGGAAAGGGAADPVPGLLEAGGAPAEGAAKEKRRGWCSLALLQPYFDVDTRDVAGRLKLASLGVAGTGFLGSLEGKTDLYGPFWVCTTLIFVTAVSGNFAAYLGRDPDVQFFYDIDKVTYSAILFYGYIVLVPTVLYWVLRVNNAPTDLFDLVSLYGYSLFLYIPTAVVCIIPSTALRWVVILAAGALTSLFLARSLVGPLTVALGARGKVTMGVVALVNFSICFGLKLFFFKYS